MAMYSIADNYGCLVYTASIGVPACPLLAILYLAMQGGYTTEKNGSAQIQL